LKVRVWTASSFVASDGAVDGWVEGELVGGGAPVLGALEMNATLTSASGVVCQQALKFVSRLAIFSALYIDFIIMHKLLPHTLGKT
jgi:hypothetical protein